MFVLDSATYQVNIDSILRKSLVENREKLTKDMFDSAQVSLCCFRNVFVISSTALARVHVRSFEA